MKINSLDKIRKQAIALANANRKYLSTELELQQIEQVGDEMVKVRKQWETYSIPDCRFDFKNEAKRNTLLNL